MVSFSFDPRQGMTMMHDGRVIVEGTTDEIRANQLVHDLYLGRGGQSDVDE